VVQFAEDLKEAWLIYQGGVAVRNMDFKVGVAAAAIAFVVLIEGYLREFVSEFTVDRVIFLC